MIIIPTYNEEENIENIVRNIVDFYPSEKILVVDGFSDDGTVSILNRLKDIYPNLLLLLEKTRTGLGFSYLDAFGFVINNFPEEKYIITCDADFSHPIEKIRDMKRFIEDGFDLAIGSRYVSGGKILNWSSDRMFISFFGNIYAKVLLLSKINDLTSGFVGYNVDLLKKIDFRNIKTDGYGFQIEMKYYCSFLTNNTKEFPIVFKERSGGCSKFSKKIFFQAVFLPLRLMFFRFLKK